jgi:hypothetical protein
MKLVEQSTLILFEDDQIDALCTSLQTQASITNCKDLAWLTASKYLDAVLKGELLRLG